MFVFLGSSIRLHPWRDIYAKYVKFVVPGKEVPFGGPEDYILYLDP